VNAATLPLVLCSGGRQWRNVEPGGALASGSRDSSIRVWDVARGQCIGALLGHENWVRALLFHPAGKYLYSCADDKSIRIWDLSQVCNCFETQQNEIYVFFFFFL
jgi:WD40 repeat protein